MVDHLSIDCECWARTQFSGDRDFFASLESSAASQYCKPKSSLYTSHVTFGSESPPELWINVGRKFHRPGSERLTVSLAALVTIRQSAGHLLIAHG